jgi:hypothetical protein
MMQRIRRGLAGLVALALCGGSVALAAAHDETKAPPGMPQMSPEMQAEMEAWMKLGTPGKEHQQLAAQAGTWKAKGKSYMGPEPTLFEATSERELKLGGRVLTEHFSGDMMGMPFEGHGMLGYDNARKKWWTTWNDSMSTAVMLAYGGWDEGAKAMVFDSELIDPAGKPLKVRLVSRPVSAGEQQFEYWEERGGKLTKTMEMTLVKQ